MWVDDAPSHPAGTLYSGGYDAEKSELAEKIWTEQPALRVIFSSGYSADTLGRDFKLDPKFNFLQKPYQPDKLTRAVRNCLDVGKI